MFCHEELKYEKNFQSLRISNFWGIMRPSSHIKSIHLYQNKTIKKTKSYMHDPGKIDPLHMIICERNKLLIFVFNLKYVPTCMYMIEWEIQSKYKITKSKKSLGTKKNIIKN